MLRAAPADAAAPGGVAGSALWFAGAGYNGATWTDQSGSGLVTAQAAAPAGATAPGTLALDANFNPGASFNGSSQWLRGTVSSNVLGSANSYVFGVSNWNGSSAGLIGNVLSEYPTEGGEGLGFYPTPAVYFADSSGNYAPGPFSVPTSGTTPYILSDCYYPNASLTGATTSQNAISGSPSGNGNAVVAGTQFEIGGRTAGGLTTRLFAGTIDEVIYYQSVTLSATQISQIRSYLALKYGITLGYNTNSGSTTGTNYLSSAGTTVWAGAGNAAYQYDVAGIGRDASSGLDQRVSHSVNVVPVDVTIANGTALSTASQSANTAFANDQTFVVWGDNNGSATVATYSGITRMGRVWRAQTTGTGSTNLAVRIPSSTLSGVANPVIWVASDANFQTAAAATSLTCASGYCTGTIATFPSGSTRYFSFGGVTPAVTTVLSVSPAGNDSPGTVLTYTGTFTNSGTKAAVNLAIVEPIPAQTQFQIGSQAVSPGTSGLTATYQYSKDSGSTYTYTPVSGAGGAPTGYDRLVTDVKFVFSGSLGFTSPNNTAGFSLNVMIQ